MDAIELMRDALRGRQEKDPAEHIPLAEMQVNAAVAQAEALTRIAAALEAGRTPSDMPARTFDMLERALYLESPAASPVEVTIQNVSPLFYRIAWQSGMAATVHWSKLHKLPEW